MLKHALIGSALGGGIGLTTSKKENRKRSALIGAGVGAGLGVGAKYGRTKYKEWIKKGAPKKHTYNANDYKEGDIMIVKRGSGADHYGIYVGEGKVIEYGSPTFDPRGAKRRAVTLDEFGLGDAVRVEAPNGRYTRKEIVDRAHRALMDDPGKYHLFKNNCEHFARNVANGERISTQTNNLPKMIGEALKPKSFSVLARTGPELLELQKRHLIGNNLFKIRKHLTKDLGGLNHFDKHQTNYLTGGGSVVGGLVGRKKAEKQAHRDAKKYNLKEGTLEYDNFIRQRKNSGTLKGAGIGAGFGFGTSKGADLIRGKVVADKARVKGQDLGRDYLGIGKGFRGLNEKDIDQITKNWKETGEYTKSLIDSIR